ncbi:hypothetical protein FRC03_010434 [Tulasnella sp. 419]|nr:hypothetical protein FRC03_010434 [Tulasnella sp. 419]
MSGTSNLLLDENESRDVRESNLLQQSPSASSLSQENSFHSSSLLDIADSSEQSPTARRRNLRPRGTVVYGKKGQRVTRRIPQTRDSLLSQCMEGLQDDSVFAAGINTDNVTCSQKIQSISCSPENDDTPDYTPQIQPVLAARKLELTISDIAKSLRNADGEANARRSGFNEASNHRHHILDATSRRKQRSRQKRRNSLDCSSSLAFVSLEEHEAGLELLKSSFDKSKRFASMHCHPSSKISVPDS